MFYAYLSLYKGSKKQHIRIILKLLSLCLSLITSFSKNMFFKNLKIVSWLFFIHISWAYDFKSFIFSNVNTFLGHKKQVINLYP